MVVVIIIAVLSIFLIPVALGCAMNERMDIAVLLILVCFACLLFASWCPKTYYMADDVEWTVVDKYGWHSRHGGTQYHIEIEYVGEDKLAQRLDLTVSKDEWDACTVGGTCWYPEEIVSNWEHLKEVGVWAVLGELWGALIENGR